MTRDAGGFFHVRSAAAVAGAFEQVFYPGSVEDVVTGSRGHTVPRHVWVCQTGRWHERSPGLILEWRRSGPAWEALVVWASGGGVRTWELVHGWVRAEHVRPRE